jgi:hypothetical protein
MSICEKIENKIISYIIPINQNMSVLTIQPTMLHQQKLKLKTHFTRREDADGVWHTTNWTLKSIQYELNRKFGEMMKKEQSERVGLNLTSKESLIDIIKANSTEKVIIKYYNNQPIVLCGGKYGKYICYDGKNITLKLAKNNNPYTVYKKETHFVNSLNGVCYVIKNELKL